jgi:riboflavin-specific deaminase-like protein
MKTKTSPHPHASRLAPRASLPFVFINMAMTADGKIATANRAVSSFGSARDVEHLYELRATADAVMAGARTLDLNKVLLGPGGERFKKVRRRNGLAEFSLRIIVSGAGSIDPNAAIFQKRFSPILILTTERASKSKLNQLLCLVDEVMICGKTQIDFAAALRHLRRKWNVKRLLCEGGGELNAALFRARLVDELHLTICPKIFGGRHAPTIAEGDNPQRLAHAAQLELKSLRRAGDELFLTYRAKHRDT